ncbi:hypothetical protein V1460_34800 [Streptomyces sp. SCSIO 30461]|uniref:hypothetical protein n=1 Tax=Streptomyces sp. SCSIO 30461 TaxID=3118085 RepID=UPI0030CC15E7
MTVHNELRLLPWSGPDGKPCFLSPATDGGYLSRLADNTEAVQLGLSAELLEHALDVLAADDAETGELRLLAFDLTGALRDILRVAESRGHRLPTASNSAPEPGEDGPHLPVSAFC